MQDRLFVIVTQASYQTCMIFNSSTNVLFIMIFNTFKTFGKYVLFCEKD
jgi:hypothetical protein